MKDTRLKHSEYSRRDFFAIGATLGASVLGSGLFNAGNALAADGAKKYRVVPDWPQAGCPRYMSRGIDADRRGRIYVACDKEHPIIIISAQGNLLGEWGKGLLLGPHGLRIQRNTVWVTDIETHMAHQFTLDGKLIRSFGEKGKAGDGPEQFNRPTDFAFGRDGAVYISDGYQNTRVVCYAPDGTIRKIWGEKGKGPGQFDLVHAIAIGKSGRVYVADRSNTRVQVCDLQGKYLTQWNHVGTPYGLYATKDGSIFLCGIKADSDRFRVAKLSENGKVLTEFGETGEGPGQFLMAHSLYVDKEGAVFVADGKANRVQKYVIS